VVPATDFELGLGRARLTGRSTVAFTYFRQYANQRSVDTTQQVTLGVLLNRIRPRVSAAFASAKQRQGLDIDVRARRMRFDLGAGVDVRVSPKTAIGASVSTSRDAFEDTAFAEGINLRETLTRRTEGAHLDFSYEVTPLTTVILPVEAERHDFSYDPLRGSTSIQIAPRVEFKPTALIQGSASVGFRRVTPSSAAMQEFSGVVAAVDLGYSLRGSTRLALTVGRDLVYSFRQDFPYFLLTGVGISARQQLTTAWDVHGSFGRQQLDYRRRLDAGPSGAAATVEGPLTTRTEGWSYGAGLGYRVGRNSRITFEVMRSLREAGMVGRDFEGWQAGTSVFYGF
jgi:hypothetical protein